MPIPGLIAPLGARKKATISYRGALTNFPGGDSNPGTMPMGNISLGADNARRLVVVTGGFGRNSDHSGTPSVTVGGVLLTQDAYTGGSGHIIGGVWSGVVPTGDVTAVSVGWSTSLHKTQTVNVFVLLGLDLLVAQAQSGRKVSDATGAIQALCSSQPHQIMVVGACNDGSTILATYPAGFTEVYDAFDTESQTMSAAYAPLGNAQANPTVNFASVVTQKGIAAAVYQ